MVSSKEQIRVQSKYYYMRHKDVICKKVKKWQLENKEKRNASIRKNYANQKLRVLNHYGHKCACCGESRIEFLTIDHINNDGNIQRKALGYKGNQFRRIIKLGFPKDLQILCANCNYAKAYYGICPHKEKDNE